MSDDSDKTTIIKTILSWAATQPFNNILLLIIAAQISYAVYSMMQYTLPEIHKTQKSTLLELQINHIKERDIILKTHKDERKELIEFYNSWLKRADSHIKSKHSELAELNGCN